MQRYLKKRTFFDIDEEFCTLCFGVFCTLLGAATLFSCARLCTRMMLLVGACVTIFGAVQTLSALRHGKSVPILLRGVFFAVFGVSILLANAAGVMFSARVLGTMLFVCGAAKLATCFVEKTFRLQELAFGAMQTLMGATLVLFSAQRGVLAALAIALIGIQTIMSRLGFLHILP